MPKKKGLGVSVEKALGVMDTLVEGLKEFAHSKLKDGLVANKISDEKLHKDVTEASSDAFALMQKIKDLRIKIDNAKPDKVNTRFANQVVKNFLEGQIR